MQQPISTLRQSWVLLVISITLYGPSFYDGCPTYFWIPVHAGPTCLKTKYHQSSLVQGLVPFDLANQWGNEEMLQVLVNASIAARARSYKEMWHDYFVFFVVCMERLQCMCCYCYQLLSVVTVW